MHPTEPLAKAWRADHHPDRRQRDFCARVRVHTEDGRVTIDTQSPRIAEIQRAVEARDGILKGAEWWFTCPSSQNHTNGDRKPSARWNPEKKSYFCDPCGEGGGWVKLEGLVVHTSAPVSRPVRQPSNPQTTKNRAAVEVTTYDYHRADGTPTYQVVRMSDKSFRQRQPDPNKPGKWIWNLSGVERVPYHLPELIAAQPSATVFIAEGEKDVDNLIALGAVATTNPGGAGKWRDEFSEVLKGRSVVALADCDEAGRRHAQQVAVSVSSVAASTKVVQEYTGLESIEKADVSDWIAIGKTLDDLYALADRTPQWIASPANEQAGAKPLVWYTAPDVGRMAPEHIDWSVESIVAKGAVTEISGLVKVGKTTFVGSLIRAVLSGEPFINSTTRRSPVVWLTEERPPTFRSMLDRVGLLDHADLHILFRHETGDASWSEVVDQAVLKAEEVNAELLTIDTLSGWSRLQGDDENSAGAAMMAMEPVHRAAAAGLGVILNRHDRKGGGPLGESGRGSSAFAGEVDILLQLRRANSPGNTSRREVASTGRFDGIPDTRLVEFKDGRYIYLGDTPNVERQDAKAWLLEHLPNEDGEPLTKSDIREQIDKDVSNSTIDRALIEMVETGDAGERRGYGESKRAKGYWLTGTGPSNPDLSNQSPKGLGGGVVDSPTQNADHGDNQPITPSVPPDVVDSKATDGSTDVTSAEPTNHPPPSLR